MPNVLERERVMDDFPVWLKMLIYAILGLTCIGLVVGFLQAIQG
jgi:hypothetical protein